MGDDGQQRALSHLRMGLSIRDETAVALGISKQDGLWGQSRKDRALWGRVAVNQGERACWEIPAGPTD